MKDRNGKHIPEPSSVKETVLYYDGKPFTLLRQVEDGRLRLWNGREVVHVQPDQVSIDKPSIKLGDRGKLNPATVPSDVYARCGTWTLEVVDIYNGPNIKFLRVQSVADPDKDQFSIYPEDFIPC